MKKVGILGGTFDPPHYGHLLVGQEVLTSLGLDEVWFVPTNTPPHKEQAGTPAIERLKMVELAIGENDRFFVNPIELNRSGPSYSVDTMYILKEKYPSTSFYFIIGADMVDTLHTWDRIEELVKLVTFVGVKRPGYFFETTYPVIEVELPAVDISSSFIRKRLKENGNVTYLLTEKVQSYIKENNLYE